MRHIDCKSLISRRELLKDGLRGLLAGGLFLTGAVLALRSGPESARGSCLPDSVCRSCCWRSECGKVDDRQPKKPTETEGTHDAR